MSELDKPSLDENTKMPKETKIKIIISIIMALLIVLVVGLAKPGNIAPPPPDETAPPADVDEFFDDMHVAKSSWRDGAWCAIDKEKVTSITILPEYDGDHQTAWTVDEMMFYATENGEVYISVGPGVHMVGSMHKAFANFTNAASITGLSLLETSNVTDMSYLFAGSGFYEIDISTWDTARVANFSYMVYNTPALEIVNMSNLDLSNVVDISYIFAKCEAVDKIYFENVDTSHILTMEGMFNDAGLRASRATTTFYGTLDTSSCTNFKNMFKRSRISNTNEIVKNFNTEKATNMSGMFCQLLNVRELDLSGWNVSNVVTMEEMFWDANMLKYLNMEGWAPTKLTNANKMFMSCYNLLAFNQWGPAPNLKYANQMFEGCFEMRDINVTCFDGAHIQEAKNMFYCLQYVKNIYSNGFEVENYFEEMFAWCVSLEGPTPYDENRRASDMATTSGYLTPTK